MSAVAKSHNYEEFKAKREEEKKARKIRIEERLATIASIRTKKIKEFVTQKENAVVPGKKVPSPSDQGKTKLKATEVKRNFNSVRSTHSVLKKPLLGQNSNAKPPLTSKSVRQNNKTIITNQSIKSKISIASTAKPNTKEFGNITSQQNVTASKSNILSTRQPPNATAADDRRRKLEMWRLKKLEECNKNVKTKKTAASLPVESKTQTLENLPEKILLTKQTNKDLAIKKVVKDEAQKNPTEPKNGKLTNLPNQQGQTRKRISLSSKHLAEQKSAKLKKVEKVIPKEEAKKNAGVVRAPVKVTRPNEGYSIEIKGKTPVVKPLQRDISKSIMKEKLNVWLKAKGKSPSVCKRHMCCYGLQNSTPIRPPVKLQSKTVVKECKRDCSQEFQKPEPATESKVIIRRRRKEVEGENIFRSSDIFLKCKEVVSEQKMHFPCEDGDASACETPMKKHFIVTPVRRSTRKSCVPMSLKDHDMIVESMDELPAEHRSTFKPNKCLTFAPGVGITPERKQLDFNDV